MATLMVPAASNRSRTSRSAPVLSVVSPVHCEELGIAAFLDKVEEVLASLHLSYEIVLIDDGSTDNSWQCMQNEAARRPTLRCLRLSRNFGKEAALVAGLDAARGQAVITLDSDLQHPPDCIPEMVRLWQQGEADLVEAQKSQRQKESFTARLFAKSFYALFALVAPFDLRNASDFKLMDRKVLNAWKQFPERRVFFRGLSSWVGFRQKVIFFEPHDRHAGVSQWSFQAKIVLALDSLSAYTTRLLVLIWGLSIGFAVFALGVGGEALWMKFQGLAMSGMTTVILLILISTASILAAMCLLSLYVRQIFYEVKCRPLYLISEDVGATDTKHTDYHDGQRQVQRNLPLNVRKSAVQESGAVHKKRRPRIYGGQHHHVTKPATQLTVTTAGVPGAGYCDHEGCEATHALSAGR